MKYSLIILVVLFLFECKGDAQTKIGDITVSDRVAKEYFLDCYSHPDTVKGKSEYSFYRCTNCVITNEESGRAKILADEFNDNLKKFNIGQANKTVYYKEYNDTLYDGVSWANYDYRKGAKKIEIKRYAAGSYVQWLGYLMPRKPSEQDFIKWLNKNK